MAEDAPRPWFWLLKSEPNAYALDDLERDGATGWDGIRNAAARNQLREMEPGEQALFYHSSTKPTGVVGVCRVTRAAYPDPGQHDPRDPYFDPKSDPSAPRWSMVDVEFMARLPRIVTLAQLKADPRFRDMTLLRQPRLSVQRVSPEHFEAVLAMGGGASPPRPPAAG